MKLSPVVIVRSLIRPSSLFEELAESEPSPGVVFFGLSLWLLLAPPVFAFAGAANFGWNPGGVAPFMLATGELVGISVGYFVVLLLGFVSTAVISQWMAATYGARQALGVHFALISVVATPLAVGSAIHLYPHLVVNFLVLVPMLIWSLYLLYWGLPVALKTNRERGMLMASSLVAYLLVAAVSLLGITVVLWTYGVGPRLWI
jgi:hypothetical protein